MRIPTIAMLAAGLCIFALAGCGGDNTADEKSKFTTEPYREVESKGGMPPATKDGKPVGFQ